MYSFLIVDDEPFIRNAIVKIVDWKSLNIGKVFQAENGYEAQEILIKENIDLVLSDIEMPGMDGLKLSKWISENYPEITVAILTGHEKFDYAKECMSYGIKDYILKPIGAKSIRQNLSNILEEVEKKTQERENLKKLKEKVEESRDVWKNKVLNRLICTPFSIQEDIETQLEYLEVNTNFDSNIVSIIRINYENKEIKDIDRFFSEKIDIVQNIIGNKHIVFSRNNKYLVIVFDLNILSKGLKRNTSEMSNILNFKLSSIKKELAKDENLLISCGIGSASSKMENLYYSFNQANTALNYCYSHGQNKIYDINNIQTLSSSFYYPEQLIMDLIHSIVFGNKCKIEETVMKINEDIFEKHHLSPENIQLIDIETLNQIFKELYKFDDIEPSLWKEGLKLYNNIQNLSNTIRFDKSIINFCINASTQLNKTRNSSKLILVEKAIQIINLSLSENQLSISDISDKLNISTGYLSSIFKKEMGETISKYIARKKIEEAKILLSTTNMMTYEIAYKTGFENAHYFSYAFKKIAGISPKEYRESKRG